MATVKCMVRSVAIWVRAQLWDSDRGVLWWIDIYKPTINRFDPVSGRSREIVLGQNIHAIGVRQNGGLIASLQYGFGLSIEHRGRPDHRRSLGGCPGQVQ